MNHTEQFSINNITYQLEIRHTGEVVFHVVGGHDKNNQIILTKDEFGSNLSMVSDNHATKSATLVFRTVIKLIESYVKTKRPHMLYFTCVANRVDLYTKLVKHYTPNEFSYSYYDGRFDLFLTGF